MRFTRRQSQGLKSSTLRPIPRKMSQQKITTFVGQELYFYDLYESKR